MKTSWDKFITEIKLTLGVDKLSEKKIKFCMSQYILGVGINNVVKDLKNEKD